jgi:peptidoglycan/LPS O-acetylase OafA/YrhL
MLQKVNMLHDFYLYPLVFLLAIIMATISYELFEKKFLKLKLKFSLVKTGDTNFLKD